MKLKKDQIAKLWGETGPYSETNLIIQTRILDDQISRIFVEVRVHINPLTFEIIKQSLDYFKDDKKVQDLINNATFWGFKNGYVATSFLGEYVDESAMKQAKKYLKYSEETIIKMHKFIMDFLDLN